jgi:uncharacterized protein
MNRSEILDRLYDYKKKNHEKYRVTRIGIFGSVAKGISDEKSDIDVVVDQREPDLFRLGCIKTDLEEEFGKKVDIVRFRKEMNSFLKNRIEREAVYV